MGPVRLLLGYWAPKHGPTWLRLLQPSDSRTSNIARPTKVLAGLAKNSSPSHRGESFLTKNVVVKRSFVVQAALAAHHDLAFSSRKRLTSEKTCTIFGMEKLLVRRSLNVVVNAAAAGAPSRVCVR